MATTTTVSSAFSGALAGEIFVQAFKKADTISKGAITVISNVIGSGNLPKLSYASNLVAYSCGFNATGTVGYTEKVVATKKFKIENEFCKEDFASTFASQAAGLFSAKAEMPETIQDAVMLGMIENAGAQVDENIWQGDNTANEMNGLLPQFVLDATVVDVTIAAVTKANVVAQMELAYDAIPATVEDDEDLVIAVSKNVAKAYKQAQASMGLNTTVGDKELDYLGTRIESIGGLPADSIVIYRVKNVAFLTGLQADFNRVDIKDMDETDLSGNVRTKMVFSAGVGYSFGSEIVYARPA